MSGNWNLETDIYYTELLQQISNVESKLEDNEDGKNELTELKRTFCGCLNKEITEEVQVSEGQLKTEQTQKFYTDLDNEMISIEVIGKISKLVAELAKDEKCRDALVHENLFIPLNKNLKKDSISDLTRTQICRAIGNLCYYNEIGRLKFLESCGLQNLMELAKYCSSLDLDNNSDQEKNTKTTLITVVLGCLHNLTNDNETLRKAICETNIMSVLKDLVKHLKGSIGILVHFGSLIENLLELDQAKKQFVQEKVGLKLFEFLDEELLLSLDEYAEDFFQVLSLITELEMSVNFVLESDLIAKLISIMEKNSDNSDLLRHLGLYLVSLLIKEEKVEDLFSYKDGLLLNKSIEWLSLFNNEHFHVTSAVIIANYIRNDENVSKLILDSRKTHVKILEAIKSYENEGNMSMQQINAVHSLLGALRNLCVAVSYRNELLKENLIQIVLPLINNENLEIKFKVLSILRFLVKNCTDNNGLALIFEEKTLETLEKISSSYDHAGIIGESSRLICYLPVAAKSEKNLNKFSKFKFIDIICTQLESQHLIMMNEALLALNVIVSIDYGSFMGQLKLSKLSENLKALFLKESIPIEMKMNALKLCKALLDKNDFFTEEQLEHHLSALNSLKFNNQNNYLKSSIEQLIDLIQNIL